MSFRAALPFTEVAPGVQDEDETPTAVVTRTPAKRKSDSGTQCSPSQLKQEMQELKSEMMADMQRRIDSLQSLWQVYPPPSHTHTHTYSLTHPN